MKYKVFKKFRFIKAAGIYGSFARGENTASSDIDLWIYVENADDFLLAKSSAAIKQNLPSANILVLDKDKLQEIKKIDIPFYYSLYFGSIIIYGEAHVSFN